MNQIKTDANSLSTQNPDQTVAGERLGFDQEPRGCANRGPENDSQALAGLSEYSSAIAAQPMMHLIEPAKDGAAMAGLMPSEALRHLEHLIEQSLASEDQRAEALLAIHDQKLYLLTYASFRQYVQQRWRLSGSRAYQLIQFARLRKLRQQTGQSSPANERQARRLAAQTRPTEGNPDSYDSRLQRISNYLRANLAASLASQRRRLLLDVRQMVDDLHQALEAQPAAPNQDLSSRPKQAGTSVSPGGIGSQTPLMAQQLSAKLNGSATTGLDP